MLAKVYSYGISGLDAFLVQIEVSVSGGLPTTIIVGLPDNAIRESKERVRSAIKNSGFSFDPRRITINLSPADTKKEGPSFDLAIALGILAATEQINPAHLQKFAILGELSLDGTIQPIHGALAVIHTLANRSPHEHIPPFEGVLLPKANAAEAALYSQIPIFPIKTLSEAVYLLSDPQFRQPFLFNTENISKPAITYDMDFNDVKGQSFAKRGLEIAASGGHNVLMIGPPGSGKSMLAKRLPTILPEMTIEESLETTKIYSIAGLLKNGQGLMTTRPFRSPHHSASNIALVGGGSSPKPGEVTLSHNGILFLDELPEFHRDVLEALRQPLEDREVTIARALKTLRFPAKFILVAAMNPCPCGYLTDRRKKCSCTSAHIQRYISKISGPLLDRIDIHLEVPSLASTELLVYTAQETSAAIKERTTQTRQCQLKRFSKTNILTNAEMNHRQIREFCPLSLECKKILKQAIEELSFSARVYDKILKISRTIADLANEKNILPEHLAEAIQYRNLDRDLWQ